MAQRELEESGYAARSSIVSSVGIVELLALWRSRVAELWNQDNSLYVLTGERLLRLGEPLMAYDVLREGLEVWPSDIRLRQL